jgi:hypothetical protein
MRASCCVQAALSENPAALACIRDSFAELFPALAAVAAVRASGSTVPSSFVSRTFGMWRHRVAATLFMSPASQAMWQDGRMPAPAPPRFAVPHTAALAGVDDKLAQLAASFDVFGLGPAAPSVLHVPFKPHHLGTILGWVGSSVVRAAVSAMGIEETAAEAPDSRLFGVDTGAHAEVVSVVHGSSGLAAPARVKRPMLRGLGAGAEDAVIGYWRFEIRPDDEFPASVAPDLSRHGNKATLFGYDLQLARLDVCDAPVDHGDPDKVRKPRACAFGTEVGPMDPVPVASALAARICAGGVTGATIADCVGACALAVPVPAWSYLDVGTRPEDPVSAAFSLELWAKVGVNSATTPEEVAMLAAQETDSDGGSAAGSPPPLTVLAVRFEPAGAGLRTQWALVVTDTGALAFYSYANDSSGVEVVQSRAGVVSRGLWAHVCVVVDGSSVARRGASKPSGDADDDDAEPTRPCCVVKLLLKGEVVATGTVAHGQPLPSQVCVFCCAVCVSVAASAPWACAYAGIAR